MSFSFDLLKTDARVLATSCAFVKIQMPEINRADVALLDGSGLVGIDRALPLLILRFGR